ALERGLEPLGDRKQVPRQRREPQIRDLDLHLVTGIDEGVIALRILGQSPSFGDRELEGAGYFKESLTTRSGNARGARADTSWSLRAQSPFEDLHEVLSVAGRFFDELASAAIGRDAQKDLGVRGAVLQAQLERVPRRAERILSLPETHPFRRR